ncbi:MAG: hypothetical protein ACREIT_03390 [Tepidisphaeraceae bacterium]
MRATAILLLVLTNCPTLHAWSNKEHIQLTRLAAMRLIDDPATPPEMKTWLRQITPGLRDMDGEREYFLHARVGQYPRDVDGIEFWVTVPDLVATFEQHKKVEPFGVPERLLHFIDLEFFVPDESKRWYKHDLSGKPGPADVPRDKADPRYQRAGMLPFRVVHCYGQLVHCLRAKKLTDAPGQFPRDEHAARWAGYLAHYLEDNTQPHHATIDYKSESYFADKKKAPNIHAEMEYRMGDDEANDFVALREAYWPLFVEAMEAFEDPVETDDPWASTLEVSMGSYDYLPLIGDAATHANKQGDAFDTEAFFRFRGEAAGLETSVMEMKARQQAWAVARVAKMWRRAWDQAHAK